MLSDNSEITLADVKLKEFESLLDAMLPEDKRRPPNREFSLSD